ncbi:hypothetical protein NLJ89_g3552 [Agrocybe chaxingu]|uniref:Uncharacterized protein n=1 Tax=Agrocybe chaxingu TaxID=84603 RepID=A0A9W8MWS8_9AGAR|nr:hypothetical protein NLJ89_g3552 [Agrocybe chaxingu]
MADFYTFEQQDMLPHIPDNLTVAQFMLDYQHEIRPLRGSTPCLIDDATDQPFSLETVSPQVLDTLYVMYKYFHLLGNIETLNDLILFHLSGEEDTVMLVSPNHIGQSIMICLSAGVHRAVSDYPVAIWAVHKLGGIVTCSNPLLNVDELVYQLETAGVTFVLVHSSVLTTALDAARTTGLPLDRVVLLDHSPSSHGLESVQSVPTLIKLGHERMRMFSERVLCTGEGKTKIALLCWSSGTTGKPKAVAIPHHAFIANIIQMAAHNQVGEGSGHRPHRSYGPGDVALVLPFYHVAGLVISLHLAVFCAMTLVVVTKYDFNAMLESILRHDVSHLVLVPPQAVMLAKYPAVLDHDFTRIKYVIIGAAPVSRDVQERLCRIFPSAQIGQAYGEFNALEGLTEMTTTLAMVSSKQRRGPLGSAGRLLPGIQARVVKPDGTFARYGERGELIVKGPGNALGYFNNPEATSETFIDGWVHTGDEVVLTKDREVFVFDRLKEFMKVRGFQVAPAELEGCLLSHPDVADACVVGLPDDYSGELPLAYIVLSPSATDIIKHVDERKAGFKRLTGGVRFVASIPSETLRTKRQLPSRLFVALIFISISLQYFILSVQAGSSPQYSTFKLKQVQAPQASAGTVLASRGAKSGKLRATLMGRIIDPTMSKPFLIFNTRLHPLRPA